MRMNQTLLRALEYARNGDFAQSKDILYGFVTQGSDDEKDLDYCWRRVGEREVQAARR